MYCDEPCGGSRLFLTLHHHRLSRFTRVADALRRRRRHLGFQFSPPVSSPVQLAWESLTESRLIMSSPSFPARLFFFPLESVTQFRNTVDLTVALGKTVGIFRRLRLPALCVNGSGRGVRKRGP